jgi:hypothetical protein
VPYLKPLPPRKRNTRLNVEGWLATTVMISITGYLKLLYNDPHVPPVEPVVVSTANPYYLIGPILYPPTSRENMY